VWVFPSTGIECEVGLWEVMGLPCSTLSLSELLEPEEDEDEPKEGLGRFGAAPGSGVGFELGLISPTSDFG
jgi:hypothetical protein